MTLQSSLSLNLLHKSRVLCLGSKGPTRVRDIHVYVYIYIYIYTKYKSLKREPIKLSKNIYYLYKVHKSCFVNLVYFVIFIFLFTLFIYIYIQRERERERYIYICIYIERESERDIYICIYIYIERERDSERQREKVFLLFLRECSFMCPYVIYVILYMYMHSIHYMFFIVWFAIKYVAIWGQIIHKCLDGWKSYRRVLLAG